MAFGIYIAKGYPYSGDSVQLDGLFPSTDSRGVGNDVLGSCYGNVQARELFAGNEKRREMIILRWA
jgi:hypothetical protein